MKIASLEKDIYYFYCPGCKMHHYINSRWDIDIDSNSISPSIMTNSNQNYLNPKIPKCHIEIKNGIILYKEDSTNGFAGQSIEMEELENV